MTVALIVGAGSGERLGASSPKALVELAGRPLVQWSIDALAQVRGIEQIVLALPAGVSLPAGAGPPTARPGSPSGVGRTTAPGPPARAGAAPPDSPRLLTVEGGAVRSDSVKRALAASRGDPVLVHDAARPLLTPELARAVIDALRDDAEAAAAIAAAPVTDTVKRVDANTAAVTETLDRAELWAVQTPQVFRRQALERALDVPGELLARATDDAWLIERDGGRVIVVPSDADNLKVTTPLDLDVAELLLSRRLQPSGRLQPPARLQPSGRTEPPA